MADERDDKTEDEQPEPGRETAVDHTVVDEGDASAQETSVRDLPKPRGLGGAQPTSIQSTVDEPPAGPEQEKSADDAAPEGGAYAAGDKGATEVFFSRDEPSPAAEPDSAPQPAAAPSEPPSGTSPAAADRHASEAHDKFEEKPELFVAGAFAAAFVVGKILKRLTRSDD